MKCECTLARSLNGDGCPVCNPTFALEVANERIAELEAKLEKVRVVIAEWEDSDLCDPCTVREHWDRICDILKEASDD